MWYVIQTKALHELEMVLKCQDILKDGEEVFTMETEKQKRKNGEWQTVREVTFQKYIFVETDDPDDLRIRLRDVKGMTKMLCVSDTPTPIYPEEEELLRRLGGDDHVIGKSRVYNMGDRIKVIDGPLANMEGVVKWTDRRQHIIGISVRIFGDERVVKLSADYIEKEYQ